MRHALAEVTDRLPRREQRKAFAVLGYLENMLAWVTMETELMEPREAQRLYAPLSIEPTSVSQQHLEASFQSAGLAVNSPHFTGRALDLYVGGEPVDTRDSNRAVQVQTPVYQWLVLNADRFGFRPYCYEPWHWEYVGRKQ